MYGWWLTTKSPLATGHYLWAGLTLLSLQSRQISCWLKSKSPSHKSPRKKAWSFSYRIGPVPVLEAEVFSHHKGHSRFHKYDPGGAILDEHWLQPTRSNSLPQYYLSQLPAHAHARARAHTHRVKNLSDPVISHRLINWQDFFSKLCKSLRPGWKDLKLKELTCKYNSQAKEV